MPKLRRGNRNLDQLTFMSFNPNNRSDACPFFFVQTISCCFQDAVCGEGWMLPTHGFQELLQFDDEQHRELC